MSRAHWQSRSMATISGRSKRRLTKLSRSCALSVALRTSAYFESSASPISTSQWIDQASRYGMNVADVQDAVQTAVGGNALSQVLVGEQRYDLVLRYQAQYRDTKEAIEKIRLLAPSGNGYRLLNSPMQR